MTAELDSSLAMQLCRAFVRHGVTIAFGQSLPTMFHRASNRKLFLATTRFIHLDIARLEIRRNYEALRLLGDAKLGIAARSLSSVDVAQSRQS